MMNPEIKAAWIAWLENPSNVQVQGRLRQRVSEDTIGHCCLGGLVNVTLPGVSWYERLTIGEFAYEGCGDDGEYAFPGPVVLERSGLTSSEAKYFANLNDEEGYNFLAIAQEVKAKV